MKKHQITKKTDLSFNMSIKVPLDQLWAAFKDLHRLLPRLLPGFVEGTRISEGPLRGGVGIGAVRYLKFSSEEVPPGISWSQELIEEIDDQKHIFAYKVVDGDVLQKYSSFRVKWRFQPQVAGPDTEVSWTADVVPVPPKTTAKHGNGDGVGTVDDGRGESLYKDSAMLLMKQLETHLRVTGEYLQPSPKEQLREDLLFN